MNQDRLHILIIGCGGREHAIVKSLSKSKLNPRLFCFGTYRNPGIYALVDAYATSKSITDINEMLNFSLKFNIDFAIIGGESPLEKGVADILKDKGGIPCIGPYKSMARLETSKEYCRSIIKKYGMAYLNPEWKVWDSKSSHLRVDIPKSKVTTQANYQELKSRNFSNIEDSVRQFVAHLKGKFVIKCDGLNGGKGVKVSGDHFSSTDEGIEICKELYNNRERFLIEEKLEGDEFSLFSLCDGKNFVHCPIVKDYKRAQEGDRGINTGGMGCFSLANHKMPFLTDEDVETVQKVNEKVIRGLMSDNNGDPYIGIVYGSFIKTSSQKYESSHNLKVIEYNVRFGDPEGINLLELLDTDFVEVCLDMLHENLHNSNVKFKKISSKCVYIVPKGYPKGVCDKFVISKQLLNEIFSSDLHHIDLIVSGIDHTLSSDETKHGGNVYIEEIKTIGTGSRELVCETVGCKKIEKQIVQSLDDILQVSHANNGDTIIEMDEIMVPVMMQQHSEDKNTVNIESNRLMTTGSRTLAIVGIGNVGIENVDNTLDTLKFNEDMVDKFYFRRDIGNGWMLGLNSNEKHKGLYSKSGVNIETGNEAVASIQQFVRNTYISDAGKHIVLNEGGFGGLIRLPKNQDGNQVLINSSDSVGSKSIFVRQWWGKTKGMKSLGHDIVNHCVNDILVQSPYIRPWTFMDYYATHTLNAIELRWFIQGVSEACIESGCVLIGGETAEIPGIYRQGTNDLVGAITGLVNFDEILKPKDSVVEGDIVYGIKSNSPHTNGYTLIQHLIGECESNGDSSYLRYVDDMCQPHRCYLNDIRSMSDKKVPIKGMCHITGGGFIDNPKRVLADTLEIEFDWELIDSQMPEWMKWIKRKMNDYDPNCTDQEIRRTFNCGYGMLVIVDKEYIGNNNGMEIIGRVVEKK